jgi:hypothetical protein
MTCDEAKLVLASHWTQSLSSAEEIELEAHLGSCEACRREADRLEILWRNLGAVKSAEEPDSSLRVRFYETLAAYRDGASAASGRRLLGWKLAGQIAAGVVLLLGGVGLGYNWHSNQVARAEVTQLRGEVGTMRQLVALSLMQQQSASERLRGVSWAYQVEPPDNEVWKALVAAVNQDSNVNVRLAAVDALRPYASSPATRPMTADAALQALSRETEPIVQVALIDLLVDSKEKQAQQALHRVASDASADADVRERAHWALERLQ